MRPGDEQASLLVRTLKLVRTNAANAGPAMSASYTLLGAILVLGGLGYALDVYLGTAPALVTTGLLLGVAAGLYHLAKLLWQR